MQPCLLTYQKEVVYAALFVDILYHVCVELALRPKPLVTHEPHMVQLPNLEDRLLYERQ